jgi:serine/threonine protein kinase
LLASVEHPCIITLNGIDTTPPSSMIDAYFRFMSLGRWIGGSNLRRFDDTQKMILIVGIVAVLRYLRRRRIRHRDLSPAKHSARSLPE